MAEYDQINRIELPPDPLHLPFQVSLPVDEAHTKPSYLDDLFNRQCLPDLYRIHIRGTSPRRRDGVQFSKNGTLDKVSRVKDKFHIFENIEYERRKRFDDSGDMGV